MSRRRDSAHEIWEAEMERDYPEQLSPGEEARLDNWAETQMEQAWP